MADQEDKTTIEASGAEDKDQPQKKGMNKMILFGGIGVGAIVIGVVLALFVLKPMMAGGGEGAADETEVVDADDHAKAEDDHKPAPKKKASGGSHGEASESLVFAIKDIVVNPAGTGGTRFLSASFGFELGSQETVLSFQEREPIVRDALITILSSKTVAQLTDVKQKEVVRYQIKRRLETVLGTEDITGVYFTDFVLQ